MKIVVIAVGTSDTPGVTAALRHYEERAGRYFDLEVIELPTAAGGLSSDEVREREGEALLRRRPDDLELLALTREGKGMTSRALARYLGELATYGRPGAVFALGGAHGLASRVLEAARFRLSLSPMTLPHALARLVLAEQIYRAGTILRGEPYHKGTDA